MISNFPTKRSYNPGGYSSFQFIIVNQVDSYPVIYLSNALSAVVPKSGYAFLTGYATMETLAYNEKAERTDDGIVVQQVVSGLAPGEKDDLINLFYEMERHRFLVIITDSFGRQRLVGSLLNPLQFKADFTSGERRADGKMMNFSFYTSSRYKAPVYGNFPEPPAPVFWNTLQSQSFTRNNCADGSHGTAVIYSVLANTFSAETQEDADALALADITANGQANANALGECELDPVFYNTLQSQSFSRQGCAAGSTGSEVLYSVLANTYSAETQEAADALALADIAANGQDNANDLGSCELNDIVPITYTLTEGDGETFLDNNLLFNIGADYADGYFNAGSGSFNLGRVGQTIIAQQNYYGGELDSTSTLITPWPYPVTAVLQLLIDGVVSSGHNLSTEFPADQPAGGLQSFSFVLEAGKTYEMICTVTET